MEPNSLVVGRTYYRLTFADSDLTMPGVEPLVFLGEVTLDDGIHAFAFQDTVSYVRFGSRLQLTEDNDEILLYFIPDDDIGTSICDIATVVGEISAAGSRAEAMNHPVLPVLGTGWQSGS